MWGGVTPHPQHNFSQKEVFKCIESESHIPGLFKTLKIIRIRSIMMEKEQNEKILIFFYQN